MKGPAGNTYYPCIDCERPCRGYRCRSCAAKASRERADCATGYETMEEIDALVAEQYRNLPPWWDAETRRKGSGEDR